MYQVYENLFLCKYCDIKENLITEFGITHIINLSQMKLNKKIIAEILNLDIPDRDDFDILKYFKITNKFISDNISKGNKILVCCLACISRSPTIILAYLIKKKQMSFNNAFDFLVKINDRICPNYGFLEILKNY